MNYNGGMLKTCECNSCCDKPKCGNPCGCPLKVLSVETMTDKPGYVKFNLDGGTVMFDFSEVVAETETDTFLRVDATARVLKYLAEGHINNIPASQLGSILHIADIGDVDISGVTDNSLFVYQKNSDCGKGCDGIDNSWIAWNADDPNHLTNGGESVMVFDDNSAPKSLMSPAHTEQFYLAGWRAGNKFGYMQPTQVTRPTTDSDGYTNLLFESPITRELEVMPVKVTVAGDGTVTFKTRGGA